MRDRSSRSTFHWSAGWVFTTRRMAMPVGPKPSTPQTSGSSSTEDPTSAECQTSSAAALMTRVASSTSVSKATCTSSSARDHCCDLLPTRRISPLGTCHTVPSTSRRRVVRRLTPSTRPEASPTSTMSPTPNWSSTSMKMPERKSFTRLWAPKPSATPAIPAPAMSGPSWTPNSPRTTSTTRVPMTALAMLRRTAPMVSARCRARALAGPAERMPSMRRSTARATSR